MLDLVALSIIFVSLVILVWSLSSTKKGSSRPKKTMAMEKPSGKIETLPFPSSGGSSSDEESEIMEDIKESTPAAGLEMSSRPLTSSSPPTSLRSEPMDDSSFTSDSMVSGDSPTKRKLAESVLLERKASLVYWERMCFEEEFDLTVTLHQPEFKEAVPD